MCFPSSSSVSHHFHREHRGLNVGKLLLLFFFLLDLRHDSKVSFLVSNSTYYQKKRRRKAFLMLQEVHGLLIFARGVRRMRMHSFSYLFGLPPVSLFSLPAPLSRQRGGGGEKGKRLLVPF